MTNGLELYRAIGRRETLSQRWNDLSDKERQAFIKLAQGVVASVKLHNETEKEIAKYLFQYTSIRKEYLK